ncbi:MAG: hypothetical protein A4S14_12030 [Proteobacteria bacterium SG_bin9]|nr:MAG: hypothetical protein A4S14_12030 [Proteobacteria bacterium SG_bin9]
MGSSLVWPDTALAQSGLSPLAAVGISTFVVGVTCFLIGFGIATLSMRRKVRPLAADATREASLRLLAEQRQAEAQEDYKKLFESSIDGIYVTTPSGEILNANPALARMMGYDTAEQLIDGVKDVAHNIYVDPAARDEYELRMRRDGFVREYEYQVRQRNGNILWLSDSASVVRDEAGKPVRYEGVVRDITHQREVDIALENSRRFLQRVIDTVPAVINVKDRQFRYILMNRYMAGVFGIEPDEAIGKTTAELMSRYGAAKTDRFDRSVLESRKETGFYEDEYADSTGAMRQWVVNKVPSLGPDGLVEAIFTVSLDITDRKRIEQEMRAARDASEEALRNLKETQNSLIEAEKLAALGRLVAGVAHEVNNPVGISLTVASSLERRSRLFKDEIERGELRRSSLNDFVKACSEAADQLVSNLNRAAELIQSFKQVAADRNYSDRRTFDMRDLTEQLITSLRPGIGKNNVKVQMDCEPGLSMTSYPGSYGQVLTNLFVNSITHAFPDRAPGEIDIKVRRMNKEQIELLFSDNGCGMTPEVRRQAFDPFFTTRRDQGGTGLGLHIVYNLVTNRLGGRINMRSEAGKGTHVQIVLPQVAPLEQAAE